MAIIGSDNRTKVPDTLAAPWRHLCALRVDTERGMWVASGAVIGPRTVLTTADVLGGNPVEEHSFRTDAIRSIDIVPALAGESEPFGRTLAAPRHIRFDRSDEPRFGAIVLDHDAFTDVGWFDVIAASDAVLTASTLFVGGYPIDRSGVGDQYVDSGMALRIEPDLLHYAIDTAGGQSGSPVWITDGRKHVVVGVHSRGGVDANSGYRITPGALQSVVEWTSGIQAPPPTASPNEVTLAHVLERLEKIEGALQALLGRVPPTRSGLDRALALELTDALLDLPGIDTSAARKSLLIGIRFLSIQEVDTRSDIIRLLQDIEKADPPAYLVLIDNAMRAVPRTQLAERLQILSGKFQAWLDTKQDKR